MLRVLFDGQFLAIESVDAFKGYCSAVPIISGEDYDRYCGFGARFQGQTRGVPHKRDELDFSGRLSRASALSGRKSFCFELAEGKQNRHAYVTAMSRCF